MLGVVALAWLLLCGCMSREWKRLIGDNPEPQNIIAIDQIVKYPRAKSIEKEIDTFSGGKICVNANSLLFANAIKKVELLPRDPSSKFYDLKLRLTRKGRLLWMQIAAEFAHEKLAFLIDGMCYRTFKPRALGGGGYEDKNGFVIIDGPFDKFTAEALAKHAEDNFYYFNGNPSRSEKN